MHAVLFSPAWKDPEVIVFEEFLVCVTTVHSSKMWNSPFKGGEPSPPSLHPGGASQSLPGEGPLKGWGAALAGVGKPFIIYKDAGRLHLGTLLIRQIWHSSDRSGSIRQIKIAAS